MLAWGLINKIQSEQRERERETGGGRGGKRKRFLKTDFLYRADELNH